MVTVAVQTLGYFRLIFRVFLKSGTKKCSALLSLEDFEPYLKGQCLNISLRTVWGGAIFALETVILSIASSRFLEAREDHKKAVCDFCPSV